MFSLALFAWWEILLLAVTLLFIFVSVIKEEDHLTIASVLILLAGIQWGLKVDIRPLFYDYTKVFKFLVTYLTLGTLWSFFKWFLFVKKTVSYDIEYKSGYHPIKPPSSSLYKDDIVRWILTWPISLTWSIMEDLCVWICKQIYRCVGRVYEAISKRVFDSLVNKKKELKNE